MNALADHLRPPGLMLKRGLLVFIVVLFFCDIAIYLSLAVSARLEPQYWIALLVVMGGALAWFSPRARWEVFRTPVFLWCVLFIALTLIFFLAVPTSHVEQLKERFRDVVLLTALLSVFIMARDNLDFLSRVILLAVLLGVVLNIVSAVDNDFMRPLGATGHLPLPGSIPWAHRSAGFYPNPNESGVALTLGMLLTVAVLRDRWRGPFVVFVLAGIIATFSREAFLGWIIAVVCLCAFKFIRWRAVVFYILAFGVCAGIVGLILMKMHFIHWGAVSSYQDEIQRFYVFAGRGIHHDASVVERWKVLKLGWTSFLAHPLIGNGIGFTYHWNIPISTHNMYLLYMDDYGIVGLFLYPLLILCMIWRAAGDTRKLAWAIAIFLLFWGFFDHNIVQNYYSLFAIALTAAMATISARYHEQATVPTTVKAGPG